MTREGDNVTGIMLINKANQVMHRHEYTMVITDVRQIQRQMKGALSPAGRLGAGPIIFCGSGADTDQRQIWTGNDP